MKKTTKYPYYKIGKREKTQKAMKIKHAKKDTKDRYYKIGGRKMKHKERKNRIPGKR